MRFATNIISKKNRLNFESQIEISKQAKLKQSSDKKSVEMMMKRYYENASNLSNFNNLVLETFKEKNVFVITKERDDFYIRGKKIGILLLMITLGIAIISHLSF